LVANKNELRQKARLIYQDLKTYFPVAWDDRGNIGKRYYAQDEIGTPWCITVDYDTLEDESVTVRDRDSAKQERVKANHLVTYFQKRLEDNT
jgi:glycyl-tRNA synthetase